MNRMDPAIKEEWLAALRSGRYTQGKDALKRTFGRDGEVTDTYCCLGVLCEIAVKHDVIEPPVYVSLFNEWRYGEESAVGELPPEVSNWAGLAESDPMVPHRSAPRYGASLSGLNDGGVTFEEIADIIEREL